MSFRKRQIKIRPAARTHIKDILKFTQQQWGQEQRLIYKQLLYDAFDLIRATPLVGKKRDEIRSGYLSYHQGRHHIFYVVDDNCIEIIAIVHDSMDLKSFFAND